MTSKQLLEWQADRIEATLVQYGLAGRVTGGILAPRWVQFHVRPEQGTRISQIRSLAEELALALNAETCRVARKGGQVMVEIPRSDPQPIHLLPMQRRIKELPLGAAVLGLGDDGSPLLVRLPAPEVSHLLIAGTTGSGKSALARTIIASLALRHRRNELSLILIDPKRRAFGPLASLPHLVQPVIVQPDEAAATLAQLVQLMLERDQQGISTPRIVVVIDELADLLMAAGSAARDSLTRLAQRGREAGIHLIACTQKPTNQAVAGSLAKANFPVRLVGQVTSPEEAKVATGYAGTGADRLRGPGDFVAVTGGQVIRFQSAYVPPQQLGELVAQLDQQARAVPESSVVLPPQIAAALAGDRLTGYVEQVRELWPTLLKEDGSLKWGAKADIAEVIFQKRSTAGHYGQVVDEVIEHLRSNGRVTYAAEAAVITRRRIVCDRHAGDVLSWLEQWIRAKITTTTPITTLLHAFSRFVGRVWVVVAFDGPRYRTLTLTFPRLWGVVRLVVAWKQDGEWIVERIY